MNTRVLADNGIADELLRSLLDGPADHYLAIHATLLKDGAHTCAWLFEAHATRNFVKLYRHKSVLRRFVPSTTARRPLQAFRAGVALHRQGFAVPRPQACIALPQGVLLVADALPHCEHLASQWPQLSEQGKRDCLAGVARTLADLHSRGFSHGDAKWHNLVMVDGNCCLVDLERTQLDGGAQRRQPRDLARFTVAAEHAGVTPPQFAHFLRSYVAAGGRDDATFMSTAAAEAQTIRRRHRRRYSVELVPLL